MDLKGPILLKAFDKLNIYTRTATPVLADLDVFGNAEDLVYDCFLPNANWKGSMMLSVRR